MGGAVKSLGGFLGLGGGEQLPEGQFGNSALSALADMNSLYSSSNAGANTARDALINYGLGLGGSPEKIMSTKGLNPGQQTELASALATGPLSGSRFATEQVMSNPLLGQLFGKGGELQKSISRADDLYNKGFQLQPQDIEAYGQASGDIARLFGQSEQSAAQSLANRGLAAAPSGAAGALFSGIQGNKNEQLAKAQMNIANMRMQNTMQRLAQQQNLMAQLGAQGQQAIGNQFQQQLAGAQGVKSGLVNQAQLQGQQNRDVNQYAMGAKKFEVENQPMNFMDFATAGVGQGLQKGLSGAVSGQGWGGGK